MTKPDPIRRLEQSLGLQLTELTDIPTQQKIIEWQAGLLAFYAGRDTDAAARREAALGRLKMSVAANTYLLDEQERLIGINLYGNGLAELPFDEPAWQHLQVLVLSGNQLRSLQLPANLPRLEWLDLGDNPPLRSLRFEGPLPALETLDASDSGLDALDLPPGFSNLKTLDVSRNKLATAVLAGDCPALEWLDLSGNQLTGFALPEGFGQLRYLYLGKNQIERLEFGRPLRNLQTLHLADNKLSALPGNLLSFSSLESLYLHKNAFAGSLASVIPSEESANAFVPVRDYLREFSKGTIQNDRVKIIIVGNGRIGKTSMFRRLRGLPFRTDEKFTHGVDLGELSKKHLPEVKTATLQANVWDFGGQHIFYATHQFFLTDDALYLLAWTAEQNVEAYRKQEKGQLAFDEKWRSREYWLENIRLHAPKGPILMVQTHYDGVHEPYDQTAYAAAPFRATCLEFAAPNDHGLLDLSREITRLLNQEIPAFGEDFPETYDRVIGEIERAKPEHKISRARFDALCQQAGITPGGETSVLEFLRTVGAVVWFDRVAALRDTIFVNPDWLTTQVYRLINDALDERKGRFDQQYLADTLPEYTPAEREQFLALLRSFELIFEAGREAAGVYISPLYLPGRLSEEAQTLLEKTRRRLSLAFVFRFPRFVPDNVMVNFLSRYGPYSDQIYWKNGISFTSAEEQDGIVELDETTQSLAVYAGRDGKGQRLQAEICRAFVELSRNANAEISLDGQCFVSWQGLLRAQELGNRRIDGSTGAPVDVADFQHFFGRDLAGVEEETAVRKPEIFFSYAWGVDEHSGLNREQVVDELYDSLAADGHYQLQRDKKDNGYRKSIREFMQRIGRGELVVVVLSDKYLKSPNCMFELLEIYRKSNSEAEEFRAKLFPVVLPDAKIYRSRDILKNYVKYWKDECAGFEQDILNVGLAEASGVIPDFDAYFEIKNNIGQLAKILSDLNTLNPQLLADHDFGEIKSAIAERVSQLMQQP
ncbi:MAG: leucine-rich repeat domain-containing protein [Saprospiraceae bacterium]|nr:leucine-rich repeat domain-containing protein [Saprospiraceae bacterium]